MTKILASQIVLKLVLACIKRRICRIKIRIFMTLKTQHTTLKPKSHKFQSVLPTSHGKGPTKTFSFELKIISIKQKEDINGLNLVKQWNSQVLALDIQNMPQTHLAVCFVCFPKIWSKTSLCISRYRCHSYARVISEHIV